MNSADATRVGQEGAELPSNGHHVPSPSAGKGLVYDMNMLHDPQLQFR